MNTTIDWLEKQTSTFGFKLVAGENGSANTITGVNIMDNPDTIRFLVGGELILSTGYFLKEDPSLCQDFIKELHYKRCAGLVIALKRYLNEIPQNMIDDADQLGFPILIVSYESNFSQISRIVYASILQDELMDADRLYKMYHKFNSSLSHEHSLMDVLNNIEKVTGFPLILTNGTFELLYYSSGAFNLCHHEDTLLPFENKLCEDILSTFACNHFEVITRFDKVIFSLTSESRLLGFICFLNTANGFNSILYNFAYSILPLIAIETINEQIRQETSRQGQNSFLKNMLSGELSESEIKLQCEIYGFSPYMNRICIVVQPDFHIDTAQDEKNQIFDQYTHYIKHLSSLQQCTVYHYHDDNNIIILMLFTSDSQQKIYEAAYKYIEKLAEQTANNTLSCHIGVSEILTGITTLKSSYYEALQSLSLGRRLEPRKNIHYYSDNLLYHLVSELPNQSYINESYVRHLYPLIHFDQEHHTELLTTLYVYLKNDCSIKDSSTELFIHRNTMASRLDKITELLPDFDLNNFEDKTILYIAFHISKLIHI